MAYIELDNECIICLSDSPAVIKYDEQCDCKPYIHTSCRDKWFSMYPNTCPICKKIYEEPLKIHLYLLAILSIILIVLFIYLEFFLN